MRRAASSRSPRARSCLVRWMRSLFRSAKASNRLRNNPRSAWVPETARSVSIPAMVGKSPTSSRAIRCRLAVRVFSIDDSPPVSIRSSVCDPASPGVQRMRQRVNCSRSIGLGKTSLTPAARAAACSSAMTPAVTAMMGSSCKCRSSRIRRVAVSPSMTGI